MYGIAESEESDLLALSPALPFRVTSPAGCDSAAGPESGRSGLASRLVGQLPTERLDTCQVSMAKSDQTPESREIDRERALAAVRAIFER